MVKKIKLEEIMSKILVIDDERAIRNTLKEVLEYEKHEVDLAEDGPKGLEMFAANSYDIVLCDIKMAKMDGIEVLGKIEEITTDIPVIMISGHGNIDTAVEAIKKGAYDFLEKPLDLNRLLITIRNAMDKSTLITQTQVLKNKVSKMYEIVGSLRCNRTGKKHDRQGCSHRSQGADNRFEWNRKGACCPPDP